MSDLVAQLAEFAAENKFNGKGPLCVALHITRLAKESQLPLDPSQLLADRGGQVAGLGKARVQAILADHGVARVLAEEGGRTSRGSIDNMRQYVAFLNSLQAQGRADLPAIEAWWVGKVREYFASKPMVLRLDSAKSLRAVVRDMLAQAQKRQDESPGTMYVGAVLQHLVGAKLELLIPDAVKHHGAFVADESSGREADFLAEDVAIHVTVSPGEALLRKCRRNLDNGLRPVIVTTYRGAPVAEALAEQQGIGERVDVFEAEQFIAGNLYEIGKLGEAGRRATAEALVERYNEIVDQCETDVSLRIQVGA